MKKTIRGFTIVELLIVIVVIAILAAISFVAYNGIQVRSQISSINSTLQQINKAINAYHAVHGAYPLRDTWMSQGAGKDTFIPGLVPDFISQLPQPPQVQGDPTLYYRSDGVDYKFLYLYPSAQTIPSTLLSNESVSKMLDPRRVTRGWGYWSSGAATNSAF